MNHPLGFFTDSECHVQDGPAGQGRAGGAAASGAVQQQLVHLVHAHGLVHFDVVHEVGVHLKEHTKIIDMMIISLFIGFCYYH